MASSLPPVRATHQFAARAGSWSYDTWGANGRPVVLIPAVLFDRATWWTAAADLRPYATMIAVDLPGHGSSSRRERYDADELVDDLAELIAGLQLRRAPVVVGHGPSATLATLFAARYATHAVVAVDPCPPSALTTDLDAYLHTMGTHAIPEQYRCMIEPAGDRDLLRAYARGLGNRRLATTTTGVTPARLAVHSSSPDLPVTDAEAAQQWHHEVYGVAGRFAHLSAASRFASHLRALL
ncbi:alpha/beta fold hydrolase [Actinoplanes rectilineatus]|uniref:alpha/beta fold hydrolase n=1 Tax=Actinoplanes rectilineatus TaxID=113571 RepID=UPI000696816E|nr:alpha/beta hydrolase [Actinoplanes rectilineatus]